MRGVPNNWVHCKKCGSPKGYPRSGRCIDCIERHPNRKHMWTLEADDRLRMIYTAAADKKALSSMLCGLASSLGFPKAAMLRRATHLGLVRHSRSAWSKEEITRLTEDAGEVSTRRLAAELGRSYPAVLMKIRSLRMSGAQKDSYSEHQLSVHFGVTWSRVEGWCREGAMRTNSDGRIERGEVLRFMVEHTDAFDPRLVNVVWFREMLSRIGLMLSDLRQAAGMPEERITA